jgi:hypothetical protein
MKPHQSADLFLAELPVFHSFLLPVLPLPLSLFFYCIL